MSQGAGRRRRLKARRRQAMLEGRLRPFSFQSFALHLLAHSRNGRVSRSDRRAVERRGITV